MMDAGLHKPRMILSGGSKVTDRAAVVQTSCQFDKIPKVAHFYWGGPLPFLHFLTFRSFSRMNPDWKLVLHEPRNSGKERAVWATHENKKVYEGVDYSGRLSGIQNLERRLIPDWVEGILTDVHRSDALRWYLLSTEGGLWSDSDILYIKPMSVIAADSNVSFSVCVIDGRHRAGFAISEKENPFYKTVSRSTRGLLEGLQGYQTLAADFLNHNFPRFEQICALFPEQKCVNLPLHVVYPWINNWAIQLAWQETGASRIAPATVGIHWFYGHPTSGDFAHNFDVRFKSGTRNVIYNLIRDLQLQEEGDSA
jgi:hypothetical protein